jgi:Na+-translocating ferredoxin:NAD+ oxidoreductase RNF subunit RnfB
MNEEIYQRLAEHLDQFPGGFINTDPGVAIRLLKLLFTPQEAELALYLTLDREEARSIADRAGVPHSETEQRLAEMAHKGLIFSVHPKDGPPLYQAVPFILGIYEFQVNNLNADLLKELADYMATKKAQPQTIQQMRTIPVGKSIEPHIEALPYEQVDELINTQDYFAVGPCICRRRATMMGGGCDAPEESCLFFGEWAEFHVRDGRARPIDRSEVTEILARADAANLVLQPNNSQDMVFLCCCCGCCCGVLKRLQKHPNPSKIVASAFINTLKPEVCQGCWTCLERCQMQALSKEGDRIALNLERCIGCGLCVTTCPSGALALIRRTDKEHSRIPVNMDATWRAIVQAQVMGRDAVK